MEKKRVTVLVAGQKFTILTEETEGYVIDIAAKIDAHIRSLTLSNMTREKAAVLTALDFADDNEQIKRDTAEIREQIKDYIKELSSLRAQNDALSRENEQLKAELKAAESAVRVTDNGSVSGMTKPAELSEPEQAEEKPVEKAQPEVTAEDDLFFDMPQELEVKPQKKPRHEHKHENPFKQQFLKKQNEQKGYTPQRQYTLFDDNE